MDNILQQKLIETYKPLYIDFRDKLFHELPELTDYLVDIPSIHIPGFGAEYPTAKRKILYLGIDVRDWKRLSFLIDEEEFNKNITEQIFQSTTSLKNNEMIGWLKENGNTSPFWNLIFKLHLALKGMEFDLSKEDFKLHLQDFAWGNTNVLQSYKHVKGKTSLSRKLYNKLKKLSVSFDDLDVMHSAFSPDVIIIFNGEAKVEADIEKYFQKDESEPKDKRWEKFLHKVSKIPLYWLYHPASGGHFGHQEETVDYFKSQLGVQPVIS
ncbi:hypothetical protein CH354_07645 [Leptospira levettii]|uniref:hypothetical protein n=1 Tax=Leptospira levettii TaxID=2023178 RepID=UPI000C297508|nr:hypothetical protein [Leptospira levettii]PJZ36985.1 hypothetical protein CH354_07645 [Leptospira levettii]